MPTPNEKQYYVELTRHSLHAVRATGPAIEFCRECPLDQKPAVEELLSSWSNGSPVRAIVAVAPQPSHWHLSAGNEASRHRSDAALRAFAANLPHNLEGPLELLSCHAEDGSPVTPVGNARWLLNLAPSSSLEAAALVARERQIEPTRLESATLSRLAAATTAIRHAGSSPVVLWHLGAEHSQLFLVTTRGVEAVAPCATGLDALFTIVQGVLGLKLRGAAARLFFNDTYDFTDAAPRIAAQLAPSLKTALSTFPAAVASAAFTCTSFTGKQAWFSAEIARAVGLASWTPDLARIVSHLQLRLPPDTSITPELLGVLHLASSHARNLTEWHPTWSKPGLAPASSTASSTPAPSSTQSPAVAEPLIQAVSVTSAPRATALEPAGVSSAATVALLPDPSRETKPAPAPKPAARVETAPARPQEKTAPKPASPLPPKTPATPPPAPTAAAPAPQKKRHLGLSLGLAAGLACAGFTAKFYFDAREAQAIIEQEKEAAAQLAAAATARAAALEEQAKAEAERIRREAEKAREEAVALARRQAEQQTRAAVTAEIEAERIANSPGILIVTTSPVGAHVSIDGGPAHPSPLSLDDLPPGSHRVAITLDGYEPVELTADIAGTQTTDLGLIVLQRATGTIAVTSTPVDVAFSVRPAGVPGAQPIREGRTPAQFEDLPPGDYAITFSRPGWKDQIELVTVEKRATANVATTFQGGALLLTSSPAGATVSAQGQVLGVTPLALSELPPQKVTYELTLDGYDPVSVTSEIVEGRQLTLDAKLLSVGRIATAGEIATPPRAYETPAPTIRVFRNIPPEVKVTFIVHRDGSTSDIQVDSRVDSSLAEDCIAAVKRWKFEPALNHAGHPLNVRVTLPIKITANGF